MMQRLALTQIGEPVQSLELQTGDEPTPGPGEALVEMEAATINGVAPVSLSRALIGAPRRSRSSMTAV